MVKRLKAERKTLNAKYKGGCMFLNLLCYIMIEFFDIFGIMSFVESYWLFNDSDNFDSYD